MTAAYPYQAALYCADCADAIRARLLTTPHAGGVSMEDSNDWPQGPYADGGGAADTPQHCYACETFLDNPLTGEGVAYVADLLRQHKASGRGRRDILEQWVEAYAPAWPNIETAARESGFLSSE